MATVRLMGGWAVEESGPIGLFLRFRLVTVDLPVDEHLVRLGCQFLFFISPRLQLVLELVAHIGQGNVADESLCNKNGEIVYALVINWFHVIRSM